MTKEIPLICQPNLVPPILKDEKLVTRRGTGLDEINENPDRYAVELRQELGFIYACFRNKFLSDSEVRKIKCPYGIPEDILWVRETWAVVDNKPFYKADSLNKRYPGKHENWEHHKHVKEKWKPSIHMPRVLCRTLLRIKEINIERLNDITEEDARLEGLTCLTKDGGRTFKFGMVGADDMPTEYAGGWNWQEWKLSARDAFFLLIEKINGRYFLQKNPWVWVIRFERIVS